jgi:hypothetical protein
MGAAGESLPCNGVNPDFEFEGWFATVDLDPIDEQEQDR